MMSTRTTLAIAHGRHGDFGAVIRQTRENLGLSVAEFAERLGVTRADVYQWEKGQRSPGKGSIQDDAIELEFLTRLWESLDDESRRKVLRFAADLLPRR
jgi:transcriptional regulator with XRE-family HTH domain